MTLNFGKYAGCELHDIIQADRAYLIWVAANFKGNKRTEQQIEEIKKAIEPYVAAHNAQQQIMQEQCKPHLEIGRAHV